MFKDIAEEIKGIRQDNKDLKKFGILLGAVFIVLYILDFWIFTGWSLVLGAILFGFGILIPDLLRIPHKIWMGFAVIIGYFFSRIILVILYVFVIVPIGLITRIFKGDLLKRSPDAKVNSYWVKCESISSDSIEKQY